MSDYIKELAQIKRYMVEPDSSVSKYHLQEWGTGSVVFYTDIEDLVRDAVFSRQHTQEWYGVRLKRLREWVKSLNLPEDKEMEYFSIVANGTKDVNTPPTYEQQMNMLKWELEKAQLRVRELEAKHA